MESIAYKPNADAVIERLRALYERQAGDRVFAEFQIPSPALADFGNQYAGGYCDYPDPQARVEFWDRMLKERAGVEDDSIPSAYLSEFDQGLYGGVLGGDVKFMAHPENGWISSMVAPLLEDWPQFDSLKFEESHPWFQRYLRQLEIFAKGSGDKFGLSHFILIDGLNFIFELVGATQTYMSLFDRPDMVRRAVDFAFDLNARIMEVFFDTVPAFREGTFSNMVQWIPGRIVSESVDPFHMTSAEYFEKWGREPVQRIFDRFDGGVLHIHGNGRHLLEAVCSLKNLKAIYMGTDKGFAPAFEVVGELRRRAGDMPLVLDADFKAFTQALDRHDLAGGVFYRVTGAPGADEANRCMEKVRECRL